MRERILDIRCCQGNTVIADATGIILTTFRNVVDTHIERTDPFQAYGDVGCCRIGASWLPKEEDAIA